MISDLPSLAPGIAFARQRRGLTTRFAPGCSHSGGLSSYAVLPMLPPSYSGTLMLIGVFPGARSGAHDHTVPAD